MMTGTWAHDIAGQRRLVTGQYVYTTKVVRIVPSEAQRNAPVVTRAEIAAMTLWSK